MQGIESLIEKDLEKTRKQNIAENKAFLAKILADINANGLNIPGKKRKSSVGKPRRSATPKLHVSRESIAEGRRPVTRQRRSQIIYDEGAEDPLSGFDSPDENNNFEERERVKVKRKRVRPTPRSADEGSPKKRKIDMDEVRLEEISYKCSEKIYDTYHGTTCHQCRQKTIDQKTVCKSEDCTSVRGQFCGVCLKNRYGEDAREALLDENWTCPPCRGICNCSICRNREGFCATGILIHVAQQRGFPDVNSYLQSLRDEASDSEDEDDEEEEEREEKKVKVEKKEEEESKEEEEEDEIEQDEEEVEEDKGEKKILKVKLSMFGGMKKKQKEKKVKEEQKDEEAGKEEEMEQDEGEDKDEGKKDEGNKGKKILQVKLERCSSEPNAKKRTEAEEEKEDEENKEEKMSEKKGKGKKNEKVLQVKLERLTDDNVKANEEKDEEEKEPKKNAKKGKNDKNEKQGSEERVLQIKLEKLSNEEWEERVKEIKSEKTDETDGESVDTGKENKGEEVKKKRGRPVGRGRRGRKRN